MTEQGPAADRVWAMSYTAPDAKTQPPGPIEAPIFRSLGARVARTQADLMRRLRDL